MIGRQSLPDARRPRHPPPATPALAADVVQEWLKEKRVAIPGLVLENGSGLSRRERVTAAASRSCSRPPTASAVREEFASSLAVAAMDGTVQRRFQDGSVAGQALLEDGNARRRARAGRLRHRRQGPPLHRHGDRQSCERGARRSALDYLVQWVYREGATYDPALRR